MNTIREVAIPPDLLIGYELNRLDYQDCYEMLVPVSPLPLDDAVRAFFYGAPAWVRQAMALRDRVMGSLGYQTHQGKEPATLDGIVFTPGLQFGLFRILKRSDNEVVMGADDAHLDFRVSVHVDPREGGTAVLIATVVEIHNAMGRLYFSFVKRPHRLVVHSMMRNIRAVILERARPNAIHRLTS